MPTENIKEVKNALDGFTLQDDEDSFFGIPQTTKEDKTSVNKVVNEVKGKKSPLDKDDEDDDNGEATPLNKDTKKGKEKKKEDEEVEEEEPEFNFGDDKEEVVEDKDKDTKPKDKKDKVKNKESENKEEKEGKDEVDTESNEEDDSKFYTTLAKELKEKNVFTNVEIPDKDLTYEEFIELQDAEVEARVDESFESFFEELDEDGKAFLKFKKDGGKTSDFLNMRTNNINLDSFDEDSDKQQESIIRFYLANVDGKDEEDIESNLQWLKDGGKIKATAKKYYNTLKKVDKDSKEAIVKQQAAAAETREKSIKEFNTSVKKIISSSDKIGAFPINKAEQKVLTDFITNPTAKVGKNSFIPEFNVKLNKLLNPKNEEDIKKLVVLAKLLRNDFDVSDITLAKTTEKAKEVRETLKEAKTGLRKVASSGDTRKSLAEFFLK